MLYSDYAYIITLLKARFEDRYLSDTGDTYETSIYALFL